MCLNSLVNGPHRETFRRANTVVLINEQRWGTEKEDSFVCILIMDTSSVDHWCQTKFWSWSKFSVIIIIHQNSRWVTLIAFLSLSYGVPYLVELRLRSALIRGLHFNLSAGNTKGCFSCDMLCVSNHLVLFSYRETEGGWECSKDLELVCARYEWWRIGKVHLRSASAPSISKENSHGCKLLGIDPPDNSFFLPFFLNFAVYQQCDSSVLSVEVHLSSGQDLLDSDTLLDEDDLKKPDPASLKSMKHQHIIVWYDDPIARVGTFTHTAHTTHSNMWPVTWRTQGQLSNGFWPGSLHPLQVFC